MSQTVLHKLEQRLPDCLQQDRHRLLRRWQALRRRWREAGADALQAQLRDLDAALAHSCALRERRQASIPAIDYPAGLPVSACVAELKQAVQQHQVVIVAGETGSGKTTQLPKLCLDLGRGASGMIGHTQPRRLAARTVAARIAEEIGAADLVGHQVRFTDTSTDRTLVKLMTDGILLAETQHDPFLNRYDTLIIDEAHERSLNIDFLLGYLKRLLPKRPDLKLLITSATIDLAKFSRHFDNAPIIEVSGRTYPVELLYRPPEEAEEERELAEQVVAAFEEILRHERQQRPAYRDVLVFLSGEKEIREVAELLRKRQFPGLEVLPLYARLSNKEQQRVFASHAGRRIVLSTNVAETSLTVPGIGYVIDSGLARISRYSVRSKIQRLPVEAISQASANQRAGRCGRLGPGTCIRLYSEADFQARPAFTDTEITRTNLASVILQMLALKLGDIATFPFLEPPDPRAVRDGLRLLEELEAVDGQGRLLPLGRHMARLPLDPKLARVVLEAGKRHCLNEALIVVSALGIQDPRERPLDRQQAADNAHRRYAHPESDFLAFVNLWHSYEEQRQALNSAALRRYCQQQFLSWMRMREWREVHRQLLLQCQDMQLPLNQQPASYEELHRALLSGFLGQVANRLEEGGYLGARSRKYQVFPGSTLFRKAAKWLLSAELVETSQLYARMNARVDPAWIEQQARHLLRHDYAEPHWEAKRGQVVAYEKVLLFGLVLVERRKVAYGRIDPVLSRELFIRDGLVARQLQTRVPFHAHNCRLIDQVLELEDRTRRRDLLVEDSRVIAFYTEHLPPEVVDVTSLERWYGKLPREQAARLWLSEQDLLSAAADTLDLSQYPERVETGGLALPLDYAFDPGQERDGISVDVPVSVLKQVRADELDWLVPGLLHEKCTALIKALPKQWRKHFVPVPDTVARVLPQLQQADGSLRESLARQLLRLTGVQLPLDCWQGVTLPAHLQMNIRVLDEQGQVLGQGRDLQTLRERFAGSVQASISRVAGAAAERKGLTSWDFAELPKEQELGGDKLRVKAYPALVDRGDSVDLCLLDSAYRAQLASRDGVVRLLLLASRQQVRYLRKELLQDPRRLPQMKLLGSREAVLEQILMRAWYSACDLDAGLPRSQQDFTRLLAQHRPAVVGVAYEVQALLYTILDLWAELRRLLDKGLREPRALLSRQDLTLQLEHLLQPGFLRSVPWLQLQQYPRFLRAAQLRLEKYPLQAGRDQEAAALLQRLWQQYTERRAWCERHEQVDEKLDDYRWLLEELRVSLFAQNLGTRVPVSEQRLRKLWDELLRA